MSETVKDVDGVTIRPGDRIAYAAMNGRSAALRVGKVTEIIPKHENKDGYGFPVPTKLRIEVDTSSGWYGKPQKPVLIEAGRRHFVKLG